MIDSCRHREREREHIQEAIALVGAMGLDAVHTHLAAALTSLQLDDPEGEHERGHASPPPPNVFEVAALEVGVMDEATQQPTPGELLEVLELVQAGTALLLGAKRSHNWQITHWAEDVAEEAEALLHTLITAEEGESQQGGLANLRNLLEGGMPTQRGGGSTRTHHAPR